MVKRMRRGRGWRTRYRSASAALAGLAWLGTVGAVAILAPATLPAAPAGEPITPMPMAAESVPDRVRLGETLFNDPRLSGGNDVACASCHDLAKGGDDGRDRARGSNGRALDFNTPTVFNAGLSFRLNWRGNFRDLKALIEAVLLDARLMNTTWDELLAELRADPDYRRAFAAAYRTEPGPAQVVDALTAFGHALVTPDAPFDRFLQGDKGAITAEEEQGYRLFKDYGCAACHQGVNVGGNLFQRFGIFQDPSARPRWSPKPTSAASRSPAIPTTVSASACPACATSPSPRPISTTAGRPPSTRRSTPWPGASWDGS